jgi:trans-aconitate 2-methyltransferase
VESADPFDPAVYNRFEQERQQPFLDLLSLVRVKPGMRVADLGCGTGKTTRLMHDRLRAASTVGIDNSARMLSEAKALPNLRFIETSLDEFSAKNEFDLIVSNAAIHYLTDHPRLFARMTEALSDGGQLAVQIPYMNDSPFRTIAAEIAGRPPYNTASGGFVHHFEALLPEEYSRLLYDLGYREQHVRLQVYPHLLPSRDHVVEWFRGTLLTTYQRRLPAALYEQFVTDYRNEITTRFPDASPYFFPFRRLLIVGYR